MNRLISGGLMLFACCCPVFAQGDPAAPAPGLSGLFSSPDGATVEVYDTGGGDLLLTVHDAEVSGMQLTVKGDREAAPVAMRADTQFGGAPLALVGEGPELYGRTEAGGKPLEFLVGSDGQVRTVLDGERVVEPKTSAELEAAMVAGDYATAWAGIRTMAFTTTTNAVQVRGAMPPGATQRVDRVFSRQANLSETRRQDLEKARAERAGHADAMEKVRALWAE